MPFYPAKPYVVPLDDWFNNNSSNFENESKAKGTKNITTIHEFFYRQSHLKVGGSESLIQTTFEKKSSEKIIPLFHRNSKNYVSFRNEEKYNYSKIPTKHKSTIKRSFQGKTIYKNIFNFKSHLLNLKSVFIKIISRKIKHN